MSKTKELYDCKKIYEKVESCCHNCINRLLDYMCDCEELKVLSKYIKCVMCMEKLMQYGRCCCCNTEKISKELKKEISDCCDNLCDCIDEFKKVSTKNKKKMSMDTMEKLCKKLKKMCE